MLWFGPFWYMFAAITVCFVAVHKTVETWFPGVILYISYLPTNIVLDVYQQVQGTVPVAKCWQDRAAMNEKMGLESSEEQAEWEIQALMRLWVTLVENCRARRGEAWFDKWKRLQERTWTGKKSHQLSGWGAFEDQSNLLWEKGCRNFFFWMPHCFDRLCNCLETSFFPMNLFYHVWKMAWSCLKVS